MIEYIKLRIKNLSGAVEGDRKSIYGIGSVVVLLDLALNFILFLFVFIH